MSQHRAADHRPPESPLWRPEPPTARGWERQRVAKPRADGGSPGGRNLSGRNPGGRNLGGHRVERTAGGPLTAFGVSIVLTGACLLGAGLDLLLVSTAAWALTGLFLAACAYTAAKVRRSDWYSAVVGPPLAFACGLMLVAAFSPHDMGSGLMGAMATILELLAIKARAVFLGTAVALAVTLARRLPFRQR